MSGITNCDTEKNKELKAYPFGWMESSTYQVEDYARRSDFEKYLVRTVITADRIPYALDDMLHRWILNVFKLDEDSNCSRLFVITSDETRKEMHMWYLTHETISEIPAVAILDRIQSILWRVVPLTHTVRHSLDRVIDFLKSPTEADKQKNIVLNVDELLRYSKNELLDKIDTSGTRLWLDSMIGKPEELEKAKDKLENEHILNMYDHTRLALYSLAEVAAAMSRQDIDIDVLMHLGWSSRDDVKVKGSEHRYIGQIL